MSVRHFKVFGRVQHVGYRAFCVKNANRLGLKGWVRNRYGGEVEVYAEGKEDILDVFWNICREGCLFSRVDSMEVVSFPDADMPDTLSESFTAVHTV